MFKPVLNFFGSMKFHFWRKDFTMTVFLFWKKNFPMTVFLFWRKNFPMTVFLFCKKNFPMTVFLFWKKNFPMTMFLFWKKNFQMTVSSEKRIFPIAVFLKNRDLMIRNFLLFFNYFKPPLCEKNAPNTRTFCLLEFQSFCQYFWEQNPTCFFIS